MWTLKERQRVFPLVVLIAVATAALIVAGCGGGQDGDATGTGASRAASGQRSTDVAFVQGMIPHHRQAVEMAELALVPTVQAGAKVKDLAGRIKNAQGPEINMMEGWLSQWGEAETAGGHQASGMMTQQDLTSLTQAGGDQFDDTWLNMMLAHHEGAVEMAQSVKAEGSNPDVKSLADRIVSAQQAEIAEMKDLLAR